MSTQFAALTINVDASQVQVGDQLIWGGEPNLISAHKSTCRIAEGCPTCHGIPVKEMS
jgi:hypothetical protein